MDNKDTKKIIDSAKRITAEASQTLVNAATIVIDKAQTPVNPVSPNKKMNILIAGVLGVMIGLFIIILIEFLNNKINTPQDIEKELGLPLLGVIPEEL